MEETRPPRRRRGEQAGILALPDKDRSQEGDPDGGGEELGALDQLEKLDKAYF